MLGAVQEETQKLLGEDTCFGMAACLLAEEGKSYLRKHLKTYIGRWWDLGFTLQDSLFYFARLYMISSEDSAMAVKGLHCHGEQNPLRWKEILGKEEEEEEGDEGGAGQMSSNENSLFFLVKKVIDTQ